MQIKLFSIPVMGGELLTEDLNVFLRSKKIMQVESRLVQEPSGSLWCFCVKYVDDITLNDHGKLKVDYKQVLDEDTFRRFSKMREIRKKIAVEEAIPPYVVFTDEEMATMAKMEVLNLATLKTVKGIGEKKVEKYGEKFLARAAANCFYLQSGHASISGKCNFAVTGSDAIRG
ncbi:MAG: HRDC domain-containing protein [Saprospiraceae bacterium]|nr:HRDC domain-containing protein [Saprospiraceae bacterium]